MKAKSNESERKAAIKDLISDERDQIESLHASQPLRPAAWNLNLAIDRGEEHRLLARHAKVETTKCLKQTLERQKLDQRSEPELQALEDQIHNIHFDLRVMRADGSGFMGQREVREALYEQIIRHEERVRRVIQKHPCFLPLA